MTDGLHVVKIGYPGVEIFTAAGSVRIVGSDGTSAIQNEP